LGQAQNKPDVVSLASSKLSAINPTQTGTASSNTITKAAPPSAPVIDLTSIKVPMNVPPPSSTTIPTSQMLSQDPRLQTHTAGVFMNTGTGETRTVYDDGRAVRGNINPVAEMVRQGGSVTFERGEGGRPVLTSIKAPVGWEPITEGGKTVGYKGKAGNQVIKEADKVLTAAPKTTDWIENLRRSGDKDLQDAAKLRVASGGVVGQGSETSGRVKLYLADTLGSLKSTVTNPINLGIAGGITLLATRNPAAAAAVTTAGEFLLPLYITKKAGDIGQGKATPGEATGELLGFYALGEASKRTAQAIRSFQLGDITLSVDSGKATTIQGPDQTVTKGQNDFNFIRGAGNDEFTITQPKAYRVTINSEGITPTGQEPNPLTLGGGKYTLQSGTSFKGNMKTLDTGAYTFRSSTILGEPDTTITLTKAMPNKLPEFRQLDLTLTKPTGEGAEYVNFNFGVKSGSSNLFDSKLNGITAGKDIFKGGTTTTGENGNILFTNLNYDTGAVGLSDTFFKGSTGKTGSTFKGVFSSNNLGIGTTTTTQTSPKFNQMQASQGLAKNIIKSSFTISEAPVSSRGGASILGTITSLGNNKVNPMQYDNEILGDISVRLPMVKPGSGLKATLTPIVKPTRIISQGEDTIKPTPPDVITGPKIKTNDRSGQRARVVPNIITGQDTGQPQAISTITGLEIGNKLRPSTDQITRETPRFNIDLFTPPPVPTIKAPSFSFGGGSFSLGKGSAKFGFKRSTEYKPTNYATLNKLTAAHKSKFGVISGLGARPIIEHKRGKKFKL
jgi:hypothetical protein